MLMVDSLSPSSKLPSTNQGYDREKVVQVTFTEKNKVGRRNKSFGSNAIAARDSISRKTPNQFITNFLPK